MKILTPLTIQPIDVLQSPPELHALWVQGPYSEGDKVLYEEGVYESAIDNNQLNPKEGLTSSPIQWIYLGPSNRTAAFDDMLSTPAMRDDGQNLVLRFRAQTAFTALFLDGVVGSAITINIYDNQNNLLRTETPQIINFSGHNSWWSYFFVPWQNWSRFQFFGLTPIQSNQVEIIITPGADNLASITVAAVGAPRSIGSTEQNSKFNALDFSDYQRGAFGDTEIIERKKAAVREFQVFVRDHEKEAAEAVLLASLSRRVLVIPSENVPNLTLYGILTDFDSERVDRWNTSTGQREGHCRVNFEIEGLV